MVSKSEDDFATSLRSFFSWKCGNAKPDPKCFLLYMLGHQQVIMG